MLRRAARYRFAKSDLHASTVDAVGHGGMVGFGETYIPAFALALGMGEIVSGLITTLPMLAGGMIQLVSPYGAYRLGSRRRWVVASATMQALSFVPLILGALYGTMPTWVLFAAVSCYWAASLATGSVWNAWIDTLVPVRMRACYFAHRSRLAQVSLVAGIVLGGLALNGAAHTGGVLATFAIVFLLAGSGRAISAVALWLHREPAKPLAGERPISLVEAARDLFCSPARSFILLLWVVQASVQVSGPFFNAFMLVRLHMTYGEYLVILSTAFVAKIAALSFLGGLARRIGVRKLFLLGSIGIVPLPVLWLVSHDFWFLALVQVLSGVGWGAYELGMFLLLFDEVPARRRTETLTVFNGGLMAATAAGSLFGVALMRLAGDPMFGYACVFVVSTLGRLLALSLHRSGRPRTESRVVVPASPASYTFKAEAITRAFSPNTRG